MMVFRKAGFENQFRNKDRVFKKNDRVLSDLP